MGKINFSSFCKAFTTHSDKLPGVISRCLLSLITGLDNVKNESGNRYSFKSKELMEYLRGEKWP